jgi:hypothetical protein
MPKADYLLPKAPSLSRAESGFSVVEIKEEKENHQRGEDKMKQETERAHLQSTK